MNHVTFREHRYRLLHHQNGTIGIFTVRLLQATQLRRSYWSPLALGPVKLLGFSKAHGPVSSFCEFTLDFCDPHQILVGSSGGGGGGGGNSGSNSSNAAGAAGGGGHRKPPAQVRTHNNNSTTNNNNSNKPMMVSPVIPHNDHPVWGDTCHFEFPLIKGATGPYDGRRVVLNVAVREEATAVEQMIPGMNHLHQHRLLGVGQLDLTELCYGENIITGQPLPGVRDAWIDLSLPRNPNEDDEYMEDDDNVHDDCNQNNNKNGSSSSTATTTAIPASYDHNLDRKLPAQPTTSSSLSSSSLHAADHSSDPEKDPLAFKNSKDSNNHNDNNSSSNNTGETGYGRVRVLVSYQPVGLEPQVKDIVAFESFARHSLRTTSCPPIMDPLLPLTVLDRRGSYVLVEYMLASRHEKVCARVHRNAIFVIERQNILDAATNLALLPVDVALSTPLGRATQRAVTPVIVASRELLMPALLSAKLVWMAARTTGLGVAHGILALTGTLWHEGTTSLTGGGNGGHGSVGRNHHHNHDGGTIHNSRHRTVQDRRSSSATANFVQL